MVGVIVSVTGCPATGLAGATASETLGGDAAVIAISADGADSPPPTRAVTVAARLVVNVTVARPPLSVFAVADESEPAVVEKTTGTPVNTLPEPSRTVALISLVPPEDDTVVGDAESATRFAAAAPIVISTRLVVVVVAPLPVPVDVLPLAAPDDARIWATPETFPA
jgi:hypothetical protein